MDARRKRSVFEFPFFRFHRRTVRDSTILLAAKQHKNNNKMTSRPCGAVVVVFGLQSPDFHCSCGIHPICGSMVKHDTLLRFETRLVETGKCHFTFVPFAPNSHTSLFELADLNQYKTICAAFLVSDGVVQCCVGRLADIYDAAFDHMNGRLAQVVELFQDSSSQHKIDYNNAHNGVSLAVLVDKLAPGDRSLSILLEDLDLDSSSDEN